MLQPLASSHPIVGLKQLRRGLSDGIVAHVYLAKNAEARVLDPVVALCKAKQIPVTWVASMAELGRACGIEVGAAAAGIRKEPEKTSYPAE